MKLDILDGIEEIQICVGYKLDGKLIKTFPSTVEELERVVPVYESLPGWKSPTRDIQVYDELPSHAKGYLRKIEQLVNVPISLISVGPDREKTIWMDPIFE